MPNSISHKSWYQPTSGKNMAKQTEIWIFPQPHQTFHCFDNFNPETKARLSFSTRAKGPAMATLIASLKKISSCPAGSCKDTAGPASKQRHLIASTVKKNFIARSKFTELREKKNLSPFHWPAQSAKMCVLLEPLNKNKCPRKFAISWVVLLWSLNFTALRFTIQKKS